MKGLASLLVAMLLALAPRAHAQVVPIVDASGDGAGHPLQSASWIALDASGNAYVPGFLTNNAFSISPAGVVTQIIDASGDGAGNPLTGPLTTAVDVAGNVYVAGTTSNNVFRIASSGVVAEVIDASGAGPGKALASPAGLAVDADGNLFVAGRETDNVFKITPGGEITEIIDDAGDGDGNPLRYPQQVATDAAGNVYVSGTNSSNVFRITPAGVITEVIDESGDGAGNVLLQAWGLAVGANGDVYVTGASSANAFRIASGGGITEIIDASGDGQGRALSFAVSVAVDADGVAYVGGNTNLFRIPPAGLITQILGDLQVAIDTEVDADGNVLVADYAASRVLRVPPVFRALGTKVVVKNPKTGQGSAIEEPRRSVTLSSKEDLFLEVVGHPLVEGATLRVIVRGTVSSEQTFFLDPSGWRIFGNGYRYDSSRSAAPLAPVKKILLANPGGGFLFNATLEGKSGVDDLDLLPASASPAPPLVHGDADDVSVELALGPSGRTYCFRLGGAGGGAVKTDNAKVLKILATRSHPAIRAESCL